MKILLSPAKKMDIKLDILEPMGLPMFIDRSMDGVTPYRLEMQAKAVIENKKTYMIIGEICFTKVFEMRRAL